MQVIETLKHPITALSVVLSVVGQLGFGVFDPTWALVSSTANLWFPALATTGATILPELGLPDLGTKILLGAALVYVGVQLDRLFAKVQDWQENR